jgi:hypothetical protein
MRNRGRDARVPLSSTLRTLARCRCFGCRAARRAVLLRVAGAFVTLALAAALAARVLPAGVHRAAAAHANPVGAAAYAAHGR